MLYAWRGGDVEDFVLISAGWMLDQKVTTYDEAGNVVSDDGEYQRRGAETVYVFAEFMRDKKLLKDGVQVTRTLDFQLHFSQLTESGQRFARDSLHKWMQSLDRGGPRKPVDAAGLERRWAKFVAA